MKKLRILIVSAHPDDAETGMGGTLARLRDDGHLITSVVATSGATPQDKVIRQRESSTAHSLLDIEPMFLPYREDNFYADKETMQVFSILLKEGSPNVVFAHSPMDVHPHHRAAGILTIGPCLEKNADCELFCYEVASLKHPQSLHFIPTHYVDIISSVEKKHQMIRAHSSQDGETLVEVHEILAQNRGRESHYALAEAFIRLTGKPTMVPELRKIFTDSTFSLPRAIGLY